MAESVTSIQIPPQSTGPRVGVVERYVLEFDNQVQTFTVGDIVEGATSGANGTITSIVTEGFATNSGRLYVRDTNGIAFTNDENIQVSAVTHAAAHLTNESYRAIQLQQQILSDPRDPTRQQRIDEFGATLNTFTDGSPTFGAFGTMQVGEPQTAKTYRFAYDAMSTEFWDDTATSGTVTYESNPGLILHTTTTTSGSKASRTSHYYHPYKPGVGQRVEMTCQIGDVGKTNVRRRWGYFDDDNGVYFELDGTALYACVRTNTTGSVVNTRVAQADWNIERADGTGSTGFDIDITKSNIYFIDLQWLGAGRVRFGMFLPSGEQQVAHVIENANISNLPYMRTATLPIRVEQENTGTAASTSEFRWACAVVKHTSKATIAGERFTSSTGTTLVNIQPSDDDIPVLAVRPKTTFGSIDNRALMRLTSINLANDSGSGGPIVFKLWFTDSTNLTSASFASVGTTSTGEVDTSATAITNTALAREVATFFCQAGDTNYIKIEADPTIHDLELFLDADGSTQKAVVLTADNLGASNSEVFASANWMEVLT
jgi:hypothetical protein